MTRKTLPPDRISEALALREAGYTVLAISQQLGIPTRTLERYFAKHGAKKGVLKDAAVEAARADLLRHVTCDETIRAAAAGLIADDLAHARHLRTIIINAAEQLEAHSLQDAVSVMRAAAAYSTAIKNTSDVVRHSLRLEKVTDDSSTLPQLVVAELTSQEIDAIRHRGADDAKTHDDHDEVLA